VKRVAAGRVLWVSGQSERYGADRSLFTAVTGLRDRGWRVEVVVPGPGGLRDDLDAAGVPTTVLDPGVLRRVLSPLGWLGLVLWRLPRGIAGIAAAARSVDIVHVNGPVVIGGVLGGALSGRPVVCHVRESFAGRERLWKAWGRVLGRLCRAVVVVSGAIGAEADAAGLGPRAVLIHNSIDVDRYGGIDPDEGGEGPVTMIGRINDWKGQPVLVEAIAELRRRGLAVEAELAGDAFPGQQPYVDSLRALIARHRLGDSVRLLGYVDDTVALLRRCRVYVQPSIRPEPFGLALVEAMAAGRACIASAAGGPLDIIEDGVNGMLVPPGDSVALAGAIGTLWNDAGLRARLGAAARTTALARFGASREVEEIASLYGRVLDRG